MLARRASEFALHAPSGRDGIASGTSRAADDRFMLSTFGLISAGKGLETVIEALPAIVAAPSRGAAT